MQEEESVGVGIGTMNEGIKEGDEGEEGRVVEVGEEENDESPSNRSHKLSTHSYIPKTLDLVKNVEEDVIWITSGKDTGDIYYKNSTWLHKALTKEDANAIEKPTDPGDSAKAGGSKSKSDTDVDEDSEGNESAFETEVQAPVDKKAARKENQKEVKEEKKEARKNKVPKVVKKIREKLAKAQETR